MRLGRALLGWVDLPNKLERIAVLTLGLGFAAVLLFAIVTYVRALAR